MLARAVFVDRDGVINANFELDGRPVAPARFEDFRLLPGVAEALQALKAAGFAIVVVTNQPDVATGRTPRQTVEAMHARLRAELPIDQIKVCFHTDADGCACRKPKPGMLLEAAAERGIDLARSYIVGDRWRDIGAGRAAGCSTFLVDYGRDEDRASRPDRIVGSLAEAARLILMAEPPGTVK
jgi:D-glycero-D-manno-heptose 1,7-bisphosphate phosphatase